MRTITLTRKKSFVGCLIPYSCIFDKDKSNQKAYHIQNRQTIEVEIDNHEYTLCVHALTSTGRAGSNDILICSGDQDKQYLIETKYNFFKGSKFLVSEI